MKSQNNNAGINDDNNNQSVVKDKSSFVKKIVGLRCTVLSVEEIDTVNQNFSSTVFIEGKLRKEEKHPDADLSLFFLNSMEERPPEVWEPTDMIEKVQRMKITGKFGEKLELRYFPFDTQELSVWVSSKYTSDEIDFTPDTKKNLIAKEHCMTLAEWELWDHVISRKFYSKQEYSATGVKYPIMTFTFRASRRWPFYFWNVYLPMFILVTMAGSAFVVPIEDPATRLGIALTLVLTVFAFKFTIASYVPRIAYNTLLDIYNIFALFFLTAFILLIVIVPYISRDWQIGLSVTLCVGWFLGNFVYIVFVACYKTWSNRTMASIDKLFHASKHLHNPDTSDYQNKVEPEWHGMNLEKLEHPPRNQSV